LLNQITRNLLVAELLTWKVTAPVGLVADASVVIDLRFAWLRAAESPASSVTWAPGSDPKVTVTELNLTALPMSMIRPEPDLSPPNSAVRYHWVVQDVRMLLSIAYRAH